MSTSHIKEPSKYVIPSTTCFFALILETNLSKYNSYFTGSIPVAPTKNKTKLPAAEPRPRPIGISFFYKNLLHPIQVKCSLRTLIH